MFNSYILILSFYSPKFPDSLSCSFSPPRFCLSTIVSHCIVLVWNSMHSPGCQTVTLLPEPPRFWDSSMSPSSNPPWFFLNSLKAAPPHCHSPQNVNTNSRPPLKAPPAWGSGTTLGSPTTPGVPVWLGEGKGWDRC